MWPLSHLWQAHDCVRVCLCVGLRQVDEPVQDEHPPVVLRLPDLDELESGAAFQQEWPAEAVLDKAVV